MREKWLLLILASSFVTSCGGPSAPSGTPALSAIAAAPEFDRPNVIDFQWTNVAGASGFEIQVGTTPGASDIARLAAGSATSYRWTQAPFGLLYARVRVLGEGESVSNEVQVRSTDPRHVVDALLFGGGPLAPLRTGPAVVWVNWRRGTRVTVAVSSTISADLYAVLENTLGQISESSGRALTYVIERRPNPLVSRPPGDLMGGNEVFAVLPQGDEIRVQIGSAEDVRWGCRRATTGCTLRFGYPYTTRSVSFVDVASGGAGLAHELGHAFGLGHIVSGPGVSQAFTMSTDEDAAASTRLPALDPTTMNVLRRIYAGGFSGGTAREAFIAAGLVLPGPPGGGPGGPGGPGPGPGPNTPDGLGVTLFDSAD